MVLKDIAQWLNGTYRRGDRTATGKRDGAAVVVRFTMRGTGYERTAIERRWTELDVQLPQGYPLSLYVRRYEWTDQQQIERHKMIDIELGDPAFDRQFLVEVAPAQIARRLLDPTLRGLLTHYPTAMLSTEAVDGCAVIRLAVATWLDPIAITSSIDVLVPVCASVRDAYSAIQSAVVCDSDGSPYRPILDGGKVDAQHAALADEVDVVAQLRDKR